MPEQGLPQLHNEEGVDWTATSQLEKNGQVRRSDPSPPVKLVPSDNQ